MERGRSSSSSATEKRLRALPPRPNEAKFASPTGGRVALSESSNESSSFSARPGKHRWVSRSGSEQQQRRAAQLAASQLPRPAARLTIHRGTHTHKLTTERASESGRVGAWRVRALPPSTPMHTERIPFVQTFDGGCVREADWSEKRASFPVCSPVPPPASHTNPPTSRHAVAAPPPELINLATLHSQQSATKERNKIPNSSF